MYYSLDHGRLMGVPYYSYYFVAIARLLLLTLATLMVVWRAPVSEQKRVR